MISLSLLQSCHKNKYRWEPGISAPKYYPVGDVKIDFGNAGHGSLTNFDNGWGQTYGGVVGGKWKDIPKEVFISYVSAADNLVYGGKVLLPQEKIRNLFNEYNLDDEHNLGHLVVGMAPGGWVRVWFQTIDTKADDLVNIEVSKAKLKGQADNTIGEGFRNKKSKYWDKYKTYWQNHGIPYEAWANNEKEYDIVFDFYKQKKRKVGFNYLSADGTYYQNGGEKVHQKLPVQFHPIVWYSESGNVYECNVPMPKNFKKYIEQKKLKEVRLELEIESDNEHAVLYLVTNNTKEKILRFRNKTPTAEEKKNNDYPYATEVEYFIP